MFYLLSKKSRIENNDVKGYYTTCGTQCADNCDSTCSAECRTECHIACDGTCQTSWFLMH